MPRLTLRTLLAYIDDTLEPDQARSLGRKVAESDEAKLLIERIKRVTRRRGLRTPVPDGTEDDVADPNTVAAYLSDNLDADQLKQIEATCLDSDVHLAEVAACHQILTLLMTEPVRVPPTANRRMYALVPPPASDQNRKPGKTIPVGRVTQSVDQHEFDDPDVALLLGLKRYSAVDTWAGRMKLVGAVAAIVACLVLAIYMALPHTPSQSPQNPDNSNYASAPSPSENTTPTPTTTTTTTTTTPTTPTTTIPTPTATPKGPVGPGETKEPKEPVNTKTPTEPIKAPMPKDIGKGPGLGEAKVPAPIPGRGEIGKMDTPKVIVLSREPEPGSRFVRIDPPLNSKVFSSDAIMALPGYKADVKLTNGVIVNLWGNVPEQFAMRAMVMQSRIRFHTPPEGFDSDLTLEAGRIYLSASKATGAKIRVRIASEVWDLDLPNDKTKVMVQAHTAFVPGTPYPSGGVGGEPPRTEAVAVVIRGTVNFETPARHMKFPAVKEWDAIAWNSKVNKLEAPAPVDKPDIRPDPDALITADKGAPVQRALSDEADTMKDRDGIRQHLEARMNYARKEELDNARMFAIYAYAAIVDGTDPDDTKKMVANLYDALNDSERVMVRQAAVITVSSWLAGSPNNSALLVNVLTVDKNFPPEDANLAVQLLRGYSAATYGPAVGLTSKVDDLIKYLDSDYLIIREAALGNLIGYYDIPYTFSKVAAVKFSDRSFELLSRNKKISDAAAAKIKPLVNKVMTREEMTNELTNALGNADVELQRLIMDMSIIRGPFTNVGIKVDDYSYFIKDWEARGIMIKEWMQARALKPDNPGKK
jgi:hypothetical protein